MQRYDRGLKFCWLWVLAYSIFANLGSPTQAQVVPDATLGAGKNSITNTQGNRTDITGGLRRNSALFHSFDRFSIDTNRQVYFANPTGIRNIFSRVTGGSVSNIDGLLGVSGSANLFFMNPNGIIFGPNARLDVSGSFLATTANALEFPDGQRFAATGDRAVPLVEVNIPIGLQIAANAPAMLNNQGNLAVNPGQSLTLAGGSTTHTGTLTAPGGTVQVLGNQVTLADQARVDVSSPTGGGTVLIGGDYQGRGSLLNSTQTTVGSGVSINANATGQGNGGRVIVWSDGNTQFGGNISAQGGPQGGNGGFVETSGRQTLAVLPSATVSTRASQGTLGTWLLDPADLTVQATGTAGLTTVSPLTNTPVPATTISAATIVAALNGNNVDLQATNTITVNEAIDASGNTNPGNLSLSTTGPAGTTNLNQPITLKTGSTLSGTATTVSVAATGRIQNGVDVANPTGATVTVAAGSYGEAVTVNKNLNLAFGGAGVVETSSLTTNTANTVGLTGSLTTAGDQTYNGPVTLSGATVALSGANIVFNRPVSKSTGGNTALTVAATTSIGINQPISASAGQLNVALNTPKTTLNAAISTNGGTLSGTATTVEVNAGGRIQNGVDVANPTGATVTVAAGTYGENVTVNKDLNLAFGGTGVVNTSSLTTDATNTVGLAGNLTTAGDQTYNGPVTLNGITVISAAALPGANIAFNSTLSGASNLTATAIATATATPTGGNITFNTVGTSTTPLGSLVANSTGVTSFLGDVNATSIVTNVGGRTELKGNITTTATQAYNDAVSLTGPTVLKGTTLTLGASPVDGKGNDLTLTLSNPIAPTTPIAVSNARFSNLQNFLSNGTDGTQITGDFTTTGTQTYSNAVTLNNAVTPNPTSTLKGSTVQFDQTVDGGQALKVDGNAEFRGAVGNTTPLTSVNVTGTTALSSNVTTTGSQVYTGAVNLNGNTVLKGTALTLSSLTGNGRDLTLTFSNPIAPTTPISVSNTRFSGVGNFVSNGTDGTQIAGDFTTTGTQTYSNAVTLGANATLKGSTIQFDKTVDGGQALIITGDAVFGGAVGTPVTPLQSLSVSGSSNLNGGSIRTAVNQTYTGPATLGATTNLFGATVAFQDTLSGNQALAITGNATFDRTVNNIASLKINGTSRFSQDVRTSGVQDYTGAVTIAGNNATLAASTLTLNPGSSIEITPNNSRTTLAIDTLNLGSNTVSATGTGNNTLLLQPNTRSQIVLNTNNPPSPTAALNLSEAQLNSLVNFGQVTIGQAGSTITVSSALTLNRTYNLTLQGGNLTFADGLTLRDDANLDIRNSGVIDNITSDTPAIRTGGTGTIAFNLTGNVGAPASDPTAPPNLPASFGPLKIEGTIGASVVNGDLHLRSRQIRQNGAIVVSGDASFRSTQPNAGNAILRSDTNNTVRFTGTSRIGGTLDIALNSPASPISQTPGSTLQIVGLLNLSPFSLYPTIPITNNILPPQIQVPSANKVVVIGQGSVDLTTTLSASIIPANIEELVVIVTGQSQIFDQPARNTIDGIVLTQGGNQFNGNLTLNTDSPAPVAAGTDTARITQSGTSGVTVTGKTTLRASNPSNTGSITLLTASNSFESLEIPESGTAAISQGGNMNVTSAAIANSLTLTSGGNLSLGNTITSTTIANNLTLTSGGGLTLNNTTAGGIFTAITGGTTSLTNLTTNGTGNVNVTSGGGLTLNNTTVGGNLSSTAVGDTTLNNLRLTGTATNTGSLNITSTGNIRQTGVVDQASIAAAATFGSTGTDSTIALNNPNNQIRGKIGFTTPNGADASLTNGSQIQLGLSNLGSGSNLTLTNTSNTIDFTTAALTTAPDATIRIQSIDPNRGISLNTSVPGQLSVNVTQLSTALSNRSTEIIIGQDTATGNVTTGTAPISITNPLTVHGGAITLSSAIATSGGSLGLLANTGDVRTQGINTSSDQRNGGNVQLRGQNATVEGDIVTSGGNANLLATAGNVRTQGINTSSNKQSGGNVQLQGQNVSVVGDVNPVALGTDKTGDVKITATNGDVNLTNGTAFFDVFGSSGNGVIEAPGRKLTLDNYKIVGTVKPSASSPGGTATLTANTITLKNDSQLRVETASQQVGGTGGTIALNATTIDITGKPNSETISTRSTGAATGGNIQINATDRLLLDQATIVNNTSGPGSGGNISLQSGNSVSLTNNTQINTNTSGKGNGGAVLVQGNTATLTNNAQITATNSGSGRGSTVLVQGNNLLDVNSAQITTTTSGSGTGSSVDLRGNTVAITGATTTLKTVVTPDATGAGGNVTVQGSTLSLAQGAKVEVSTQSTDKTAKGGTIAFNGNTVQITGLPNVATLSVNSSGAAEGGQIQVNATGDLALQGATVTNTAAGSGRGGTIGMVGNALTVTKQTQISANTSGTAIGGTIFLVANALTLHDQTQITALTSGDGSGGGIRLEGNTTANISGEGTVLKTDARGSGVGSSVTVAGQRIDLTDRARVEANVSSSGNGGAVQLGNASTNSLTLTDSTIATTVAAGATGKGSPVGLQGNTLLLDKAQVDANVVLGSGGRGSDINLVGGTVRLQGESQLSTRTAADNTRAGNITIAAQMSFNLVEQSRLLTTASAPGAIGGNIDFKGSQFNIDMAQVSASSAFGPAGNITVTAQNLTLRQGSLTAENGQTTRDRGGNIILKVFGRMTLSDESLISTSGRNGADSGNIFISSVSFAFAEVPTGLNGSDIIARSTGGKGGNVVFEPKLVQGFKVQPALAGNRTNDIDSNGEVNASGSSLSAVQVQIKPLEPQATSIDPQVCSIGGNSTQKESRFTIGGRGGVQLSPTALLPAQAASSDWVSLEATPIATVTPFPDGNLAVLQPGQTYQIQTVCVNSWKTQQRSSL